MRSARVSIWLLAAILVAKPEVLYAQGDVEAAKSEKSAPAAPPAKSSGEDAKPTTERAQSAVVGVEGATVYAQPNFDAPVLAALPPGMKVVISHRTRPGQGGLGLFYRIRYNKDKLGYVVDTEVIPEFKKVGRRQKRNPVYEDVEEMRERAKKGLEPIYFTRYLGADLYLVHFSEKFSGETLRAQTLTYGIRASGPGVLFDGPPLDFTFNFSLDVPRYYRTFSTSLPSGFFVMSDLALLLPLAEDTNFMFFYGLGLSMIYTQFRVQVNSVYHDSSELRLGALGLGGAAYRINKWLIRGDFRYYLEKTTYSAIGLTLQHEY